MIRKEIGLYGPDGWFNKHRHKGRPEGIPDSVENACRGKSVEIGRRLGVVPPKGTANIKGTRLRNFLTRLLPGVVVLTDPSPKQACGGAQRVLNEENCNMIGE